MNNSRAFTEEEALYASPPLIDLVVFGKAAGESAATDIGAKAR